MLGDSSISNNSNASLKENNTKQQQQQQPQEQTPLLPSKEKSGKAFIFRLFSPQSEKEKAPVEIAELLFEKEEAKVPISFTHSTMKAAAKAEEQNGKEDNLRFKRKRLIGDFPVSEDESEENEQVVEKPSEPDFVNTTETARASSQTRRIRSETDRLLEDAGGEIAEFLPPRSSRIKRINYSDAQVRFYDDETTSRRAPNSGNKRRSLPPQPANRRPQAQPSRTLPTMIGRKVKRISLTIHPEQIPPDNLVPLQTRKQQLEMDE